MDALNDNFCPPIESFCYPEIVLALNVSGDFDFSIDMSNYMGLATARFTRVGDQVTVVGTRTGGGTISATRTFPEGPGAWE